MTNLEIADRPDARMSFVSAFLNGYLAFERRRRQRRVVAEPETLNDHTLRDIGLQRFDISSAAATARTDRRR